MRKILCLYAVVIFEINNFIIHFSAILLLIVGIAQLERMNEWFEHKILHREYMEFAIPVVHMHAQFVFFLLNMCNM